jgi:[glutamine synthetase] adenylyltransferase / [glutamine synthetase]-adenylyl-L-tyrosine phosphorylase
VALVPPIPAALAGLVASGLLDKAMLAAHEVLGRFLIAARLLAPDSAEPPPAARSILASACRCGDWKDLLDKLVESRRAVAAAWQATFGESLEIEP